MKGWFSKKTNSTLSIPPWSIT